MFEANEVLSKTMLPVLLMWWQASLQVTEKFEKNNAGIFGAQTIKLEHFSFVRTSREGE